MMTPPVLSRQHLFLLRELVRRDFQGRYAGSALGFLWSFAPPLFQLALFTFVFSFVLRVRASELHDVPFAIVLFAGLLPWTAVQEGVQRATTALTENANLVRKLRFPAELLVLSVVLTALLHEAIACAAFVVVLVALGLLEWGGLPLLLIALPLQALLTMGLGLLCASAQVFVRDFAPALGLGLMAWFYATPIVYPLSLVPEPWRGVLEWNPLTPLIGLYRQALLGGGLTLPSGTGLLAALSLILAVAGLRLFACLKPTLADEV
jgi:lipopolysaccharide transport system permease protein